MSSTSTVNSKSSQDASSIATLQYAMSAGELNSETLVSQALTVVKQRACLNAFITVDSDGAIDRAKHCDELRKQGMKLGPLHGIPLAIKDNIHVSGLRNSAGTPALKDFIPTQDATVVKRLKAAGAIVLGKTNMHELAYGITSDNHAFGSVGNALCDDFIAGGSSGGTAVAVASGMAVAGLGTDTGGSIRIPAALNGLVGFRPTIGRYPADGLTRISHTRDTAGPMAKKVVDVALLDLILSGDSSGDDSANQTAELSGIRLGIPRDYFYQDLEPAIAKKTEELLQSLQRAGAELIEFDLEQLAELNEKIGFPVVLYETAELLTTYLAENVPQQNLQTLVAAIASPDVKNIMEMVLNGHISKSVYREAVDVHRPQLQQAYRDYFSSHELEAMIFPTTPLSARAIDGSMETVELNGTQVPTFPTYIRNTDPGSNVGIPSLTLPLPLSPGEMPMGIEIAGPEGNDRRLLAIGAAIETLINQEY